MKPLKKSMKPLKKSYSFPLTSLSFAALIYLSGCGEDKTPAVNLAPEFEEETYTFEIAENASSGDALGTVSATDENASDILAYSITTTQTDFAMNASTGEVALAADAVLDYEAVVSYTLQVQVSDGATPALTATATVTINVGDVNEFTPEFAQTSYSFSLAADAAVGDEVGKIAATDSDGTAMLTYTLIEAGNFAITDGTNVDSGTEVTVTVAADADLPALASPVELTITVSDGENTVNATAEIVITPIETQNVAPVFDQTTYTFTIASDAADGAVVGTVSATDSNAGDLLTYSLSGEGADNFAIMDGTNAAPGEAVSVTVAANADLPSLTSPVTLTVTVTDDAATALTDDATVEITIMEGNVAPVFANTSYSFSLSEDAADGAVVGTVSATDSNDGDLLAYSLSGTNAGSFSISNTPVASGEVVSVIVAADADLPALVGSVTLTVTVTDDAATALTDDATVEIMIIEGNVAPVFDQTAYTFAVNEDAESGDVVDAVSATDSNADDLLAYSLSGEGADNFAIDNTAVASGTDVQITVSSTASLDHETVDSYTLEVKASDDASPALTAVAEITINVGDVNEHDPVFSGAPYLFSVNENAPASTVVDVVAATDADGTATIAYSMVTTPTDFDIDANTGEIKVGTSATLDFETTTTSYMLQVEASDGTNAATADVTINVNDVNDNAPVFSGAPYTFGVEENSPVDTEVGMVSATDADANTTLQYSIVGTQTDFDIDSGTGEMTVASAALDFETTPSYTLQVQASDDATPALDATAEVTINVNDVNEAPAFGQTAYTFELAENLASGEEVGTVAATDADAGATLEYSITNTQTEFDIDANTGIITVSDAATFDRMTTSTYTLMVQVDDDDTNTAMVEVTITILQPSYDADGDGLIDINTLEQLDAMRYDLDGNGEVDEATDATAYAAAFPDAATYTTTPTGYELMRSLDFDAAESYGSGALNTAWSTNTGVGWEPLGSYTSATDFTPYAATFDGNNYTLSNLYINRAENGIGLFAALGAASTVSGLGLVDVDITNPSIAGGLAGYSEGTTIACYATGVVSGTNQLGGLVGSQEGGSIVACYATVAVTGIGIRIGGLVGEFTGSTITACYATGNVTSESRSSRAGGLVGEFTGSTITACYATGNVTGSLSVGGLVGKIEGITIMTACYATGVVMGTSTSSLGGLVGSFDSSTITASYYDSETTGQSDDTGKGTPQTTTELRTPTAYGTASTDIYSTWNLDVDNADADDDTATGTDDPWDFGTSDQYPVLKVDFDRDGSTADDVTRQRQ